MIQMKKGWVMWTPNRASGWKITWQTWHKGPNLVALQGNDGKGIWTHPELRSAKYNPSSHSDGGRTWPYSGLLYISSKRVLEEPIFQVTRLLERDRPSCCISKGKPDFSLTCLPTSMQWWVDNCHTGWKLVSNYVGVFQLGIQVLW